MQDKREIPAIVNEKIVIKVLKFAHFGWGYLTCNSPIFHESQQRLITKIQLFQYHEIGMVFKWQDTCVKSMIEPHFKLEIASRRSVFPDGT